MATSGTDGAGGRREFVVGILSDTHGSLDERAIGTLSEVDHIIHAGDVGSADVLLELEALAPLTVVRGNTDLSFLGGLHLPDTALVSLAGVRFAIAHEPAVATMLGTASEADVVICGHTHRPRIERAGSVLRVNPGAVFRPRGPEGRTLARLVVDVTNGQVRAVIVPLVPR